MGRMGESLVFFLLFMLVVIQGQGLNQYEQQYMTFPNRTIARQHLQYYTSIPHIAGSPQDYETAVYTYNQFLSFGLQAEIQPVPVYLNYPLNRVVQLLSSNGSVLYTANMTEPVVPQDPTSNNPDSVPSFNGYGASGNVTAQLVYANYGRLGDFEYLQSIGVNVTGKIVIVRYGGVFRGVKAYIAQMYGAVGVLIYSDPADDGFVRAGGVNNTYPEGPWRPEYGLQRGSVQFLPICPGSPSQERVAACRGEEWANENFVGALIPSIPVHPLSWGDALPLLQSLNGSAGGIAPASFQGGLTVLGLTYYVGPSTSLVNLTLQMNYTNVNLWNVIATLPGKNSDEVVLIGNHRDAWVFGATDPNSGSSVMLEVARSLALLKNTTSWVPERDIIFCSWDGEEYGLLGSTAYGEANAAWLQKSVVTYVNTDVGVSGPYFGAGGTPGLMSLVAGVANVVPYPGAPDITPNVSVWQAWNTSQMSVLGSGSDYTVFLDHLGIPCLDISYGQSSEGGVYHSIYDSFYWMENFGDPQFIFHENLAQFLGLILMRISDAPIIPFNYTNYASQLQVYLNQIQNQAGQQPIDWSPLANAISTFTQAGVAIDAQSACVASNGPCASTVDPVSLNTRLMYNERRLLLSATTNSSDGIPVRPWYKHAIQAPGLYSGYGSQIFPGIAQGILDRSPPEMQFQLQRAADVIYNAAQALTQLSVAPATWQDNKCYGETLGKISVSYAGGFTPLMFSINGSQWQSLMSFNNLTAGTYTVTVMDAMNLTSTTLVNITQPPKIVITTTVKDKKASAVVTGGTGTYTIVWSGGYNTSTIALADHGLYNITVTDSNGCTAHSILDYTSGKPKHLSTGAIVAISIAVGIIVIGTIGLILYYIKSRQTKEYDVI